MSRLRSVRWLIVALGLSFVAAGAFVQGQQQEGYEPHVGQPGKDVVWVPTNEGLVERMLDMAKVTPEDYVIDLGSGDGRTVIAAAKRGAHALGIEFNPDMVELSIHNAAEAGVSDRAKFVKADLFETDLSKATVITMFLLPQINLKLRPKILDLKPGTRVVSNSFTMDEWEADETSTLNGGCSTWCTAYLWIVPAKVEGKWKLQDGELTLGQQFQKLSGTLASNGMNASIRGKLNGTLISFRSGGTEYSGRVNGDTISGTVKSGANSENWKAVRER